MALENVITSLVLDVIDHDQTQGVVKAIALDSKTRYVKATLVQHGIDYPVDENATVTLTILRPDNVGVQVTGSVVDVDNSDRTGTIKGVYAELTQAALAKSGTLRAQFKMTVGEQILRTEIFQVKNGIALDGETSEWADQYEDYNLAAPFLDPDMFSGTDTEKLQSCLDMLSTTGGNILIRRRYQITANLVDKLNTETYKKKLITFIGIGQTAILNMGSYSFISDLSNAAIGGLKFINIDFEGIGQCFNTNKLIRLFFNNCRFYGFQYVIYGEGITQSLYFTQCYFEGITLSVFINISNGVWNVVFTNCICENSNRFYDGDKDSAGQGNYNVVIRDCCIESITVPAIYLSGNSHTFIVSGCYFEAATPISLHRCGALSQNIIIENNIFFLSSDETGIIMPSNNSADEFCRGVISNNECVPATALLVKESNSSQSNPTRFRLVDNIGVIDSTLKLDTKITLTPTVYRSRIEILYQSCFMDGDEVHVNIRCKANQDFAGNTIITGLPTPSVAQYIGVNVSGAYIQATTSSATGIIADSIASGTVFVISGTYNV